jgi:hypothetical protein
MMGIENSKFTSWAKMVAMTRKCLGKMIFFIRLTLPMRTPFEMITEAENQFHGKRAERRKKA